MVITDSGLPSNFGIGGVGDIPLPPYTAVIFTGNNTYTGGTTINAGATLQLGNGGTSGAIAGDVADNGALLFDRADNVVFAGAVSGPGSLTQMGTGTVTLSGANTYTGGTTVNPGGTLQIGAGGTAGSVTGNVTDNGTLVFNRADPTTFAGAVSGGGSLTQAGGGTLVLTGANTYTGGTTVNAGGTLQIGAGGTAGSVTGNVTDNGTLVFNRADPTTFAGAVSGGGSLIQAGAGTLTLTAANSYTGGTTIASGATLQLGAGGSITGNVANSGALVFNRPDNVVFPGAVSGSGSLTQAGAGVVTLTGMSTYTGGTAITGSGSLVVAPGGQIGGGAVSNAGNLVLSTPQALTGSYTQAPGATLTLNAAGPANAGRLITSGAAAMTNARLVFNVTNGVLPAGPYTLVAAGAAGTSYAGATISVNILPDPPLLSNLLVLNSGGSSDLVLLFQANPVIYADTMMSQRRTFLDVTDSIAARLDSLRGAPNPAAGGQSASADGTTVWLSATGDYTHTSGGAGAPGFDSTGGGSVLGLDTLAAPATHAGIVLAVNDEGISGGNGTSYRGQSGQVRFYAGTQQGAAFIDGQIGGMLSQGTARRSVFGGPDAQGDVDGLGIGGSLRGGARYDVRGWAIAPSLTLGGVALTQNTVQERDAAASDLSVSRGNLTSAYTLAAVAAGHAFPLGGGQALATMASIGWLHEMAATNAALSASSGSGPVPFGSAPIARDAASLSFGTEWRPGPAFSVFARYATLAAARANAQSLQVGLSYRW